MPSFAARPFWLTLVVILLTLGALLTFQARRPSSPPPSDGRLRILCTFLPVYVFTLNVVGEAPGVEVSLLVAPGVGCPHNYALRTEDARRIADADLIIANGLGIEGFLSDVLARRVDKVLTISDECDVLVRTMAHEHHEGHDHAEGAPNPHLWASPIQAIKQVNTLTQKLADADPERADVYRTNASAYTERLRSLADRMHEAATGFTNRRIVTFHDAFAYLARDLNLEVVATLQAVPDAAPPPRRIADIVDTIRRTRPAAIFCEPAYSDRLARTVARDAGVPVFTLNPFNTIDGPATADAYERVMTENLEVLQRALRTSP